MIRALIFALLSLCPLQAQTPVPHEFEVASIKSSPPQAIGRASSRMSVDNALFRYSYLTLKGLIQDAYKLQEYQVSGPAWISSDRFDIVAKIPEGGRDQVKLMLQALLADRFKLTHHSETKEMTVYFLTAGKDPSKLKKADKPENMSWQSNRTRFSFKAQVSMQGFAGVLSTTLKQPVVDQTGMEGAFDISLEAAPPDLEQQDANTLPTIFTAIEEQLGLKLRTGKGPVEMFIVDSAERPTEN